RRSNDISDDIRDIADTYNKNNVSLDGVAGLDVEQILRDFFYAIGDMREFERLRRDQIDFAQLNICAEEFIEKLNDTAYLEENFSFRKTTAANGGDEYRLSISPSVLMREVDTYLGSAIYELRRDRYYRNDDYDDRDKIDVMYTIKDGYLTSASITTRNECIEIEITNIGNCSLNESRLQQYYQEARR
ncbi:MAG: hypothetical protein FWF09_08870, partial [Bacteroidales bacterium]|nr:hypothetical protein [Bacteroidales bacterium]